MGVPKEPVNRQKMLDGSIPPPPPPPPNLGSKNNYIRTTPGRILINTTISKNLYL